MHIYYNFNIFFSSKSRCNWRHSRFPWATPKVFGQITLRQSSQLVYLRKSIGCSRATLSPAHATDTHTHSCQTAQASGMSLSGAGASAASSTESVAAGDMRRCRRRRGRRLHLSALQMNAENIFLRLAAAHLAGRQAVPIFVVSFVFFCCQPALHI